MTKELEKLIDVLKRQRGEEQKAAQRADETPCINEEQREFYQESKRTHSSKAIAYQLVLDKYGGAIKRAGI